MCKELNCRQLYPLHRRSKKEGEEGYLTRFPRTGTYYAIRAHADLLNEDELIEEEKKHFAGHGMQVPVDGPRLGGHVRGPAAAARPHGESPPRNAADDIHRCESVAGHILRTGGSSFSDLVRRYSRKYGWTKLKFTPSPTDIRTLLRNQDCVDDPNVLRLRAFMFLGLVLIPPNANTLVPNLRIREIVHNRVAADGVLSSLFHQISQEGNPTHAQMNGPNVCESRQQQIEQNDHASFAVALVQQQPSDEGEGGGGNGDCAANSGGQKRKKMSEEERKRRDRDRMRKKRAAVKASQDAAAPPTEKIVLTEEQRKQRKRQYDAALYAKKAEQRPPKPRKQALSPASKRQKIRESTQRSRDKKKQEAANAATANTLLSIGQSNDGSADARSADGSATREEARGAAVAVMRLSAATAVAIDMLSQNAPTKLPEINEYRCVCK